VFARSKGLMRKLLFTIILIFGMGGAGWFYVNSRDQIDSPEYRFSKVEQGIIVSSVSSTGTLNAVVTVKVGSQISGQIKELRVDFNSKVQSEQIIARIDSENFEMRVRQAEAEMAVAETNVAIQRAAVERARSELQNAHAALDSFGAQQEKSRVYMADAERTLKRYQELYRRDVVSENKTDEVKAVYNQAVAQHNSATAQKQAQASAVASRVAQLKMAQAQVQYAQAQVKQRKAALQNAKVDLKHTIIRSPVDGVVIERNVDLGQTVAASLQAPTLFTIAQDLRKMQVDTSIDEADIGKIQVGHKATFTVDAFPGKEFKGRINQIRKAPRTIQNVVTYVVIVSADNEDLRLLPGMTANVRIIIAEKSAALKVSNAALRFKPEGVSSDSASEKISSRSARKGGQGGRQMEERLNKLVQALQLSENQRKEVETLFAKGAERIRKIRMEGAMREEIRAEFENMRSQNRPIFLALLKPDQRQKFLKLESTRASQNIRQERVWVLNQEGKPIPVTILAGITDGVFTEVLRGDLAPDQQVIIGTDHSSDSSSKSRTRFRF